MKFSGKDKLQRKSGNYITKKIPGESYRAYIPEKLPPTPPLSMNSLYPFLEKATVALSALNGAAQTIPNLALFIYMYVRKEALLSSQIEGTQSSFSDLILFENNEKPFVSIDDVQEVSNYVRAMNHGISRIADGFPMSLRLIREIHGVLLSIGRGSAKMPGEFRTSQNWIGGTRPGNALFVPPPPDVLMDCLSDFEKFLHDKSVPLLIKAGLAHVQFETIHPFLDGNGRLGRLLIILLLCNGGMLNGPFLYLSLYFKQNRDIYYRLLQEVRQEGTWEAWLEFFLVGVCKSAQQALSTIKEINSLFVRDSAKIQSLGRIRFSCERILEHLKRVPQVSANSLTKELGMTAPTARSALTQLVKIGLLEDVGRHQKHRICVYRAYLDILSSGADPLRV